MKIPNFLLVFAGKQVAKQIGLTEDPVDTKKWYQSKTIWSDVLTIVVAIVGFVDAHVTGGKIATNPGYQGVLTVLAAIGIYGRKTATATIQ
jgi:hypothetical protein